MFSEKRQLSPAERKILTASINNIEKTLHAKLYFEEGFPEDLSKEPRTFDEILSEIKSIELQNLL